MTTYPERHSWPALLRFGAGVILIFVLAVGVYWLTFSPNTNERWLIVLGMGSMALVALVAGLAAYGMQWLQRLPRPGSTVFAGYLLAALIICLTLGWLGSILFVDGYDRAVMWILLLFALGLSLALGYLHARTVSARLDAVIGAADALRLGRYQARVEIDGQDQFALLAEVFNGMAERLEAADRKERHLDRMRRELQSWVGSDLRVPLGTVLATIDALASGTVDNPDTYLRFLRSMQRNLHLLSDLVDDLFDLTRLDTSALAVNRQPASIASLLAETLESLAHAARDRGVALSGASAPGLPVIEIDAHQMQRLLSSLIMHALHRTPAGGVVKVNAYPTRRGVLFEVLDYYEGERPKELAQLLELFLEESDVRRSAESMPLGLAIASAIVQAHGGHIRSERVEGSRGLRLVFSLDREEQLTPQAQRGM
jgi:signal transduction histidine kinase